MEPHNCVPILLDLNTNQPIVFGYIQTKFSFFFFFKLRYSLKTNKQTIISVLISELEQSWHWS